MDSLQEIDGVAGPRQMALKRAVCRRTELRAGYCLMTITESVAVLLAESETVKVKV